MIGDRAYDSDPLDEELRRDGIEMIAPHRANRSKPPLGLRPKMDVFGTDYPTPDGTCIRDYIHVCDLVRAHSDALAYLRGSGASATLNCGYGRGFSVLNVIETVKRVSGVDFKVELAGGGRAIRRTSSRPPTVPDPRSDGGRISRTWKLS